MLACVFLFLRQVEGLSESDLKGAGVEWDVVKGMFVFEVLRIRHRRGRGAADVIPEEYTAVCVVGTGSTPPGGIPVEVALLCAVVISYSVFLFAVLRLLERGPPGSTATPGSASSKNSLIGVDLSVCLLDPVSSETSTDSVTEMLSKSRFDVRVYAFAAQEGQLPTLIKLNLKFKSQQQTLLRLLSACFEERVGLRVVASLHSSSMNRSLSDYTPASSAWNAAEKTTDRPALQFLMDLAASVPFVGPIACAFTAIVGAQELVRVRGSAVQTFLELLDDVSQGLRTLLKQSMDTLLKEPMWKPKGGNDLAKHLRASFKLVFSLTKHNVMRKLPRANSTIASLAEEGPTLLVCLEAIHHDLEVKIAGLPYQAIRNVTKVVDLMKTSNDSVSRRVHSSIISVTGDLTASDEEEAMRNALKDIASAWEVKEGDLRAFMAVGFELITAEIVKVGNEAGPHQSITNPTFRYLWKKHVGPHYDSGEKTFLQALDLYWKRKRHATGADAGTVEAKDVVLTTEERLSSLFIAIDNDGNGKASDCVFARWLVMLLF